MRKAFCLGLVESAILAAGIGVDRLFPVMSAYVFIAMAFLALAVIPVVYWPEIKGWWAGRRAPAPEHSPPVESEGQAEITSDGKEVAKMMLRARDLDEVERIRTTYKRATHPEGRLFEHFVNKAYSYRLDKAGDRDKAQEFHDVVESNDKDSVGESLEFALLVNEVENESKHDG